jgi:hypothetical protein
LFKSVPKVHEKGEKKPVQGSMGDMKSGFFEKQTTTPPKLIFTLFVLRSILNNSTAPFYDD